MQRRRHIQTGVIASLAAHLAALTAVAALSKLQWRTHVELAGRRKAIQLTLEPAQSQWSPPPVTVDLAPSPDPPVVIEPTDARIAKHRHVHMPASKVAVAEIPASEEARIQPRPPQPAKSHVDKPVIQQDPTPTPPVRRPRRDMSRQAAVAQPPTSLGSSEKIPPDVSQNAPPNYPAIAIQRGWEGTVLLRLHIDATGRITQVEIARSSGHAVLDGAAATAVRRWKGAPAYQWGRPVATVETLPVRFQLSE